MALTFSPRFDRQLSLPEIGKEGQRRLSMSHILIVGAGGLGSPLIHALAAAGVGHIRVVDYDSVSLSNLNRQTLYHVADVGQKKAVLASQWIKEFYPECEVEAIAEPLRKEHLLGINVAVDAVDNYAARFLLDKMTEEIGIPMVHASVSGWQGQVATFVPGKCRYRELFGELNDDEESTPPQVLGAAAQMIGTLEAAEVLKQLLSLPNNLSNKILTADLSTYTFQTFTLP